MVAIDTVDTDLTIKDPAADELVMVLGVHFSEGGAAHNLTLKSGSTTNLVLELAANQGLSHPLGSGVFFVTQPGEDLIIQSSAALSNMLLYVGVIKEESLGHLSNLTPGLKLGS